MPNSDAHTGAGTLPADELEPGVGTGSLTGIDGKDKEPLEKPKEEEYVKPLPKEQDKIDNTMLPKVVELNL